MLYICIRYLRKQQIIRSIESRKSVDVKTVCLNFV